MTPEQNEQWKTAVMLVALGVIDGYEFTPEGRQAATIRLERMLVAEWATHLHAWCIEELHDIGSPYLPTFAIYAEVALVGIGLLHSTQSDSKTLYDALLLRFLSEALQPLIGRVEADGDVRRWRNYQPLVTLYLLCQHPEQAGHQPKWREVEEEAISFWSDSFDDPEVNAAYALMYEGTRIAEYVLFPTPYPDDEGDEVGFYLPPSITNVADNLTALHWYQLGEQGRGGRFYSPQVAQAFLTALEAECLPPNWLPRV